MFNFVFKLNHNKIFGWIAFWFVDFSWIPIVSTFVHRYTYPMQFNNTSHFASYRKIQFKFLKLQQWNLEHAKLQVLHQSGNKQSSVSSLSVFRFSCRCLCRLQLTIFYCFTIWFFSWMKMCCNSWKAYKK